MCISAIGLERPAGTGRRAVLVENGLLLTFREDIEAAGDCWDRLRGRVASDGGDPSDPRVAFIVGCGGLRSRIPTPGRTADTEAGRVNHRPTQFTTTLARLQSKVRVPLNFPKFHKNKSESYAESSGPARYGCRGDLKTVISVELAGQVGDGLLPPP